MGSDHAHLRRKTADQTVERKPAGPAAPQSGAAPGAVAVPALAGVTPLRVGPADDPAERAAGVAATRAVAALRRQAADPSGGSRPEHTHTGGCADVHRSTEPSAEVGAEGGHLDAANSAAITRLRRSGAAMDEGARASMERAFGGADFSRVRLHSGPESRELNDRMQARAFTVGSDIFFRDGVPDTGTADGAHLLGHELAHTLQPDSAAHRILGLGKKKVVQPPKQQVQPQPQPQQQAVQPPAPQLPGKDDPAWSPGVLANPKLRQKHIDEGDYIPDGTIGWVLEDDGAIGSRVRFNEFRINPAKHTIEDYPADPPFMVLVSTDAQGTKRRVLERTAVQKQVAWVKETDPLFPVDAAGQIIKPKGSDVVQGALGDCYLEAALSSLADTEPDTIVDMLKDNGDSVTVRLFEVDTTGTEHKFTAKYVQVEKSRARRKGRDLVLDKGALWVGMIEKAYAAGRFGGREAKTDTHKASAEASIDLIGGGHSRYAFEVLTGKPAKRVKIHDTKQAGRWNRNHQELPWSQTELDEYHNVASKFLGSYQGMVSFAVLGKSKSRVKAWIKWLEGGGKAKLVALWTDANGAGGPGDYVRTVIRIDDIEQVFKDNGLAAEIATPMLEYLQKFFPGKRGTGKYTRDQLHVWNAIKKGLADKKLITLSSTKAVGRSTDGVGHSGGESKSKGLVGGHAYSVLDVRSDGDGRRFVKVRNPWGSYSREYQVDTKNNIGQAQARQAGDTGVSWLELDDVTKRFKSFDIR